MKHIFFNELRNDFSKQIIILLFIKQENFESYKNKPLLTFVLSKVYNNNLKHIDLSTPHSS